MRIGRRIFLSDLGHEEQVGEESDDEECDTQDQERLITIYNEAIDSLENVESHGHIKECFLLGNSVDRVTAFKIETNYYFNA